jgi:hypothetical protein
MKSLAEALPGFHSSSFGIKYTNPIKEGGILIGGYCKVLVLKRKMDVRDSK